MLGPAHKTRILTALILAAILLGGLAAGGWPLRLLLCGVSLLALWELYQMFWPGRDNAAGKAAGLICGGIITLGSGCSGWGGLLALLGLTGLLAALRFTIHYGQGKGGTLKEELPLLFGIMYIPLSLQFALGLSMAEQILALLAAVASDIGAYYAGSLLGRHKICPTISPHKSWEGFAGGLLLNAAAVALYGSLAPLPPELAGIAPWQWFLAGVLFSLLAQFGDFFESALKREAGVKDSSRLLPGHGGILDRLDSIVLVLPAYVLLKWLWL
ncbi:MAG: phosphatidate cytidylyltransferase [Desulfovibrionaceae bacterium]|nr:phosphatidate cytidylyltransferase [Desulfovibrionaceae bacterium]